MSDLSLVSATQTEPMFKLSNVFKPSSRNMIILGTMIKLIAAGIVTTSAALFTSDVPLAIKITVGAVIFGAMGEALILFSKEEPVATLLKASEDIKTDIVSAIEARQSVDESTTIIITPPSNAELAN